MKKLLLTGFAPFLDNPVNPTTNIVEQLHNQVISDYAVIGHILPVEFQQSGSDMVRLIETYDPDAVVSLGVAVGRRLVTPERIAINCNDGPIDNRGYKPAGKKIVENGPDGYFSTLPIQHMVQNIKKANLPAEISNTAGTYLCNNVMYHTLHYFKEQKLHRPSGFIHIPASHELGLERNVPSWSNEDLAKAVWESIACL
ncbi:pyroglutamyl-peptidase I [Virgibacillus salexigens]|uniref:pyroglutamyl-peptidase I n=1 Tax=Virgibacillus salexigens TaxID=61016 RepID=UPI0030819397